MTELNCRFVRFWHFGILTHHKAKERAIQLSQEGWHPADIAASLKVSLRSVQRWIAEIKQSDVNYVESPPAENTTTNPEVVTSDDASSNPIYYPDKTWIDPAKNLANLILNQQIKHMLRFDSLLDEQLKNPENQRAIHTYSLALIRHTQEVKETASLNLLNVSRATELLQSFGFTVIRTSDENNNVDNG